jgi:SSS family solute:Na+ symporter
MVGFHLLDWIVLGAFFAGLIVIVVWVSRMKEETSSDYFLAGRNAGWLAIGASIFASNIGSEHLVGLAGTGAESGMAFAHWEMHGWIILILGWVFVPFYARSKVFTMPEFLERRYNSAARSLLSIISLVSYVLTKVAVTVYAGGVVFKEVFGIEFVSLNMFGNTYSIDFFWVGAIGLVVITGIYTVIGGMKAVLYTSVLQTPVLLIGSIVIVIAGLVKIGGWAELQSICNANVTEHGDPMMSLIRSRHDEVYPWTGVLLGASIIGLWYWCTDQYIVQRVLSGRDQTQARRGAIFGGYLKLLPVFIFLIPGMIAYALNQKGLLPLGESDAAFPTLVKYLLPIGLKGVVVGGLVAALMSSLASLFNSSSILFTVDFYKKFKPNSSEKHLVVVGRIATVVIVILGIAWIPVMKSIGKVLYAYLQDVQSLLAPGIASVFLFGVFWKRTTGAAGLTALITGFTLGMTRLIFNIFGDRITNTDAFYYKIFIGTNWLHYEIVNFLICIAILVFVSLFTRREDEAKIAGLTYASSTAEQRAETRASFNKWDVIHTVIILSVIVAFYIYFWS